MLTVPGIVKRPLEVCCTFDSARRGDPAGGAQRLWLRTSWASRSFTACVVAPVPSTCCQGLRVREAVTVQEAPNSERCPSKMPRTPGRLLKESGALQG